MSFRSRTTSPTNPSTLSCTQRNAPPPTRPTSQLQNTTCTAPRHGKRFRTCWKCMACAPTRTGSSTWSLSTRHLQHVQTKACVEQRWRRRAASVPWHQMQLFRGMLVFFTFLQLFWQLFLTFCVMQKMQVVGPAPSICGSVHAEPVGDAEVSRIAPCMRQVLNLSIYLLEMSFH